MKLYSDYPGRVRTKGFMLLETLVALSCIGMVLIAVYSISSRQSQNQADARMDLELSMMARALLDEFSTTYPEMATSGVYKETWKWEITEKPQNTLTSTDQDHHFEFVDIRLSLSRIGSARNAQSFGIVTARRKPGP